jgi:hypothetical protein
LEPDLGNASEGKRAIGQLRCRPAFKSQRHFLLEGAASLDQGSGVGFLAAMQRPPAFPRRWLALLGQRVE